MKRWLGTARLSGNRHRYGAHLIPEPIAMHLMQWRWPLVLLTAAIAIGHGIYQAGTPRRFRLDGDKLKVATAIAGSVLLGYPCAIAGAYTAMQVTRQGGKGVSLAVILFLSLLGLPFLALFGFIAVMQTNTFARSMLLFGSVAIFGGFFLAAVWGIWGGEPSQILSWRFPLAALFIAIIGGLLAIGVDITQWRWSDVHPTLRKRYVAANAVLALVAPAAVWLAIAAID